MGFSYGVGSVPDDDVDSGVSPLSSAFDFSLEKNTNITSPSGQNSNSSSSLSMRPLAGDMLNVLCS